MIRRRLYIEERMSRLAVWSLRTAVFAIPVTLLGFVLYWTETLDFETSLRTMLAGLGLAALALLLAIAAFIVIWNDGLKGLGRVVGAAALALALLLPPAAVAAYTSRLPAIHDIIDRHRGSAGIPRAGLRPLAHRQSARLWRRGRRQAAGRRLSADQDHRVRFDAGRDL